MVLTILRIIYLHPIRLLHPLRLILHFFLKVEVKVNQRKDREMQAHSRLLIYKKRCIT